MGPMRPMGPMGPMRGGLLGEEAHVSFARLCFLGSDCPLSLLVGVNPECGGAGVWGHQG